LKSSVLCARPEGKIQIAEVDQTTRLSSAADG
jgi:hypothetical protein